MYKKYTVHTYVETRADNCSVVEQSLTARARERTRLARLASLHARMVGCIIFINMKIFVCFVQQACLLAVRACDLGGTYMPMLIEE
jgi:hypothetical protein